MHTEGDDIIVLQRDEYEPAEKNPKMEERSTVIVYSSSSKNRKLIVKDMSEMVRPDLFQDYYDAFVPPETTNNEITSTEIIPLSPHIRLIKTTKQLSLNEVESLYRKYFSKFIIQDVIVIIGNILNIISIFNDHNKAIADESFIGKGKAGTLVKLEKRCDASKFYLSQRKILESELKKYFLKVITGFADFEFEQAFHVFVLSVTCVYRVLDRATLNKGNPFKNMVFLLWKSLKNSDLGYDIVLTMLESKTLRSNCIHLIGLIENGGKIDSSISDRMPLFFVSSAYSIQFFEMVINAVTNDSNDDLALLIDNATVMCINNSKFESSEDFLFPSTDEMVLNFREPTAVTQSPLINDDSILRRALSNTPNETFQ